MKEIVRTLAWQLTRKRIREDRLEPICLQVEPETVTWFNLSTNPILSINRNGEILYFRECPKLVSRQAHFFNAMEEFFGTLGRLGICDSFRQELPFPVDFAKEDVSKFEEYIRGKWENPGFRKKMTRMDRDAQRFSFTLWKPQAYDGVFFDQFGLTQIPRGTENIGVLFLWSMRSAALRFRTMRIVRGSRYSCFEAVRSVSSKIVADALGLSGLITDARFCVLRIGDEQERFGVLSEAAPGIRMVDCRAYPSSRLQRELTALHVLDLICCQPDHGPNNYCVTEEGAVCAFDNDNPYTFYPDPRVTGVHAGCSSPVGRDGLIHRSCFDRGLAGRLCDLDVKDLSCKLRPYLNRLQRLAVAHRIRLLGKAIHKTTHIRPDFLLDEPDWRESPTPAAGKTYFTLAQKERG